MDTLFLYFLLRNRRKSRTTSRVIFDIGCTLSIGLAGSVFVGILSCSLAYTAPVTLSMPELPSAWRDTLDITGYKAVYLGPDKQLCERSFTHDDELTVEIAKCNNAPVVVYPVVGGEISGGAASGGAASMKPAGALYPLHVGEDGTLPLTWYNGFTAELFRLIWARTSIAEAVNAGRLIRELHAKAPEDPWYMDIDSMAEAFQFAGFSSHMIDELPEYDVTVGAREGEWLFSDPFLPRCSADSRGTLPVTGIYPGLHHLFHRGTGARIDLFITEKEWYALNITEDSIESGTW